VKEIKDLRGKRVGMVVGSPALNQNAFAVLAFGGLSRSDVKLVELIAWTEAQFDSRMAGSPIRRIGYERWLRNLAVGLGNAPTSPQVLAALRARADHPSALVREHVAWALARHAEARQNVQGTATSGSP